MSVEIHRYLKAGHIYAAAKKAVDWESFQLLPETPASCLLAPLAPESATVDSTAVTQPAGTYPQGDVLGSCGTLHRHWGSLTPHTGVTRGGMGAGGFYYTFYVLSI